MNASIPANADIDLLDNAIHQLLESLVHVLYRYSGPVHEKIVKVSISTISDKLAELAARRLHLEEVNVRNRSSCWKEPFYVQFHHLGPRWAGEERTGVGPRVGDRVCINVLRKAPLIMRIDMKFQYAIAQRSLRPLFQPLDFTHFSEKQTGVLCEEGDNDDT